MPGTVLITGANSGIGLATALHLARHGYKVFATARKPEAAIDLAQARNDGLPIEIVPLDVTDEDSVNKGCEQVLKASGGIDILINNAGIGTSGSIEDVPVETAQRVFDTNYFGVIRMLRAIVPHMRQRKRGTIVNVTSIAGRFTVANHGHYSASKFALEAASESLAQEVSRFGIRVAIIEPGVIVTPIFSKPSDHTAVTEPYATPARRLGAWFERMLQMNQQPLLVAETIRHAIETDQPKLRYLVGQDAEQLLLLRASATDEDLLNAHRAEDDAEYNERLRALLAAAH